MSHPLRSWIGVGLYTIPEAARLTGVHPQRIRRWVVGYSYKRDSISHDQPPVWHADMPSLHGTNGLSFQDLIEVRFVEAFRAHNVPWRTIRSAAVKACEVFERPHPFASQQFKTDGRWIFLETLEETGEKKLLNLAKSQFEFEKMLAPILKGGLEFTKSDQGARWYPDWPKQDVVVDPQYSFGQPIVARGGVPTEILAKAVEVEESIEVVSKWYDLPPSVVKAAVAYENRLGH